MCDCVSKAYVVQPIEQPIRMFRNPNKSRAANRADPVDTLCLCPTARSKIPKLRKCPIPGVFGWAVAHWVDIHSKIIFGAVGGCGHVRMGPEVKLGFERIIIVNLVFKYCV